MDQFGLVSVISAFSLDQFRRLAVIAGGRTARKERSRGRVVAEAPSCARSSRLSFQCLDAKHESTKTRRLEELVRFGFGLKTPTDWFNSVFQAMQFGVVRFDR